jgi:hypothetical protein
MGENHTETHVEQLTRWEEHGATWRVAHLSDAKAIVDLCTCFGEPVERIESSDGDLIAFLRDRPLS